MKRIVFATVALAGMMMSACTSTPEAPATIGYHAMLAPGAGITSTGKGMGDFSYDPATMMLSWSVSYEGLTGPAVAAHIHGPADPGANAGPVVPMTASASPITGTATLTATQAAELAAGRYYVNVHTAVNKGGEIRGQITAK